MEGSRRVRKSLCVCVCVCVCVSVCWFGGGGAGGSRTELFAGGRGPGLLTRGGSRCLRLESTAVWPPIDPPTDRPTGGGRPAQGFTCTQQPAELTCRLQLGAYWETGSYQLSVFTFPGILDCSFCNILLLASTCSELARCPILITQISTCSEETIA